MSSLVELLSNPTEDSLAKFFLSETQLKLVCSEYVGNKSIIYKYDNTYNYYQKIPMVILTRLVVEELQRLIKKAAEETKNWKDLGKLLMKIGSKKTQDNVSIGSCWNSRSRIYGKIR